MKRFSILSNFSGLSSWTFFGERRNNIWNEASLNVITGSFIYFFICSCFVGSRRKLLGGIEFLSWEHFSTNFCVLHDFLSSFTILFVHNGTKPYYIQVTKSKLLRRQQSEYAIWKSFALIRWKCLVSRIPFYHVPDSSLRFVDFHNKFFRMIFCS
jgi:hypothetical protein